MKGSRRLGALYVITLIFITTCFTVAYILYVRQNSPQITGSYFVVSVSDGDTITVDMNGTNEKVRFIGVDTPETHKPNTPVQCFGPEASSFTKSTLENTYVRLEADAINQDRDRYGRLLRYVYANDGTMLNKRLVELGYGRALTAFPFTKLEEFKEAEQTAKVTSKGLWSNCESIL